MFSPEIKRLVQRTLSEDIGPGDLTSNLVVPSRLDAGGYIVAREPLILSGLTVFEEVIRQVDRGLSYKAFKRDGDFCAAKENILALRGSARSILTAERAALNFLMHLSGIATLTKAYVDAIGPGGPRLLDTRKTTPGLRVLEKAAVRHGGGKNHRFALFDGILIKDNHIVAAEGIGEALRKARAGAPAGLKIEIEVDDLDQEHEALENGADILLLDNMDVPTLRRAVEEAEKFFSPHRRRVLLEASGGITLDMVGEIAKTGVDFISVGAITHSARAVDIGLDFQPLEVYLQNVPSGMEES
jgi:nicotinate-nucleotide pyrophosphorylase (carboxylating)